MGNLQKYTTWKIYVAETIYMRYTEYGTSKLNNKVKEHISNY